MGNESWLKGTGAGAAGGLAGALVMSVSSALLRNMKLDDQSLGESWRKQRHKGGQTSEEKHGRFSPTVKAARKVYRALFHRDLPDTPEANRKAGEVVHFFFGLATGAVYGFLAEFEPRVTFGAGIPFGLAVWLSADETVLPLLKLSRSPERIPPAVHGIALSTHILYGLTTEMTRKTVRRMLGC